jgi:hypothetical protein
MLEAHLAEGLKPLAPSGRPEGSGRLEKGLIPSDFCLLPSALCLSSINLCHQRKGDRGIV